MHRMSQGYLRRRRAAGYALLEALVAVIVAAVGFIGAARMQTFGMVLSNSAQSRQKAVLLAYQMTDRIRANREAFTKGHYSNPGSGGPVACLAAASGCTSTELAGADVTQWLAEVAAQLPAGQGKLCLDSTPDDDPKPTPADWKCDGLGNVLAVKVAWTDNRAATTFVTVVRP
ncbi:MAG: type IV pilus modification protein PilV [Rhizobacter sp.]|nr:type IV pilus modification protein PilV [Rhizobacter sp.]